jgi:hypothetical protein
MEFFVVIAGIIGCIIVYQVGKRAVAAFHKSYGSETIGGRPYRFQELASLPQAELEAVLHKAILERNEAGTRWAFEALALKCGPSNAWRRLIAWFGEGTEARTEATARGATPARCVCCPGAVCLDERTEATARDALNMLLPASPVSADSPFSPSHCLAAVASKFTWTRLIGDLYLQRAKPYVGKDKAKLKWNKNTSLEFLRKAKELAPDAASLAGVAGLYEASLYLMYKEGAAKKNERNE